jgi:hypothetical protein
MAAPPQETVAQSGFEFLEKKGGWGVSLLLVGAVIFMQIQTAQANAARDAAIAQILERQAVNTLAMTEKLVLMTVRLEQISNNLSAQNIEIRDIQKSLNQKK